MSQKIKNALKQLSQKNLVEIIYSVYNSGPDEKKLIELLVTAFNTTELHKLLNKQITQIENAKRFIYFDECPKFAKTLDNMTDVIRKYLLESHPNLAIELCKRLIEIDERIYTRADDSMGAIYESYEEIQVLLGEAYAGSEITREDIAKDLFSLYSSDGYGCRSFILARCRLVLGQGAAQPLEKLINESQLAPYSKSVALKIIADSLNDVDTYIQLIQKDADLTQQPISDREIFDIAKRLNNAFRPDEAIRLLEQAGSKRYFEFQKTELLIEAYRLGGEDKKAQELLWSRFKKTLSIDDYFLYLKRADIDERENAKTKALDMATSAPEVSTGIRFLYEVKEYDLLEELVLKNIDHMDGTNYSVYRKVSTELARNGKYLSATLLRRVLALEVLESGKSKYYRYAVSDLKKANDFSEYVQNWRGFYTQKDFMSLIENKHRRKTAFWSKIEQTKG